MARRQAESASRALRAGFDEGGIRALDQVGERVLLTHFGEAHRNRGARGGLGQGISDGPESLPGLLEVDSGHGAEELVATDADDRLEGADLRADGRDDLAQ